ncbi:MAG: hypothetical protein ABIQ30_10220 [Devosia sp.]
MRAMWIGLSLVIVAVVGLALAFGLYIGSGAFMRDGYGTATGIGFREIISYRVNGEPKVASNVLRLKLAVGKFGQISSGPQITSRIEGEAILLDLGKFGVAVALTLLSSSDGGPIAKACGLPATTDPHPEIMRQWIAKVAAFKDVCELARESWPIILYFPDASSPTGAKRLEPEEIAARFGDAVEIATISVEPSNDLPTFSLANKLAWLDGAEMKWSSLLPRLPSPFPDRRLERNDFIRARATN